MPTELYDLLRERVCTLLGPRMGEATLRLQCELVGVQPEDLSEEQIGPVLEQLQVILCIYAGRSVAEQCVGSILSQRASTLKPSQAS